MRSHCKLIICVIAFAAVSVSCSDDTTRIEETERQPGQELYDIELIRRTNVEEKQLVAEYFSQEGFANKTHLNFDAGYREALVAEYTGLEGRSIVLTYDSFSDKDGTEVSLILIADGENRLVTHYEHVKKDAGSTTVVTVYHEGVEWFVSHIDKETGEIIDLSFGSGLKTADDDDEQGMTFAECALMAIEACVEDAGCAFMCSVTWKYCLGAIAAACLIVTA